jgi:hypothetical protein
LNSFHDHCYVPLYTFYVFELFFCLLFGYIFLNVVKTSPDLAVDAAGDVVEKALASAADAAGKMAPKLATGDVGDAGKTAPKSATDDAGDVAKMAPKWATDDACDAGKMADVGQQREAHHAQETYPLSVADGPSPLMMDICNCISYPCATKAASCANSGVAQKKPTQGGARKKATCQIQ